MHERLIVLYSSNQDQAFCAVALKASRDMKKGDDHEAVQRIFSNAMRFWVEPRFGRPRVQPKDALLMLIDRIRQQPEQDLLRP